MTSHAIHSEPPAVLTVAEVRRVLRISRTKTYEQANAYLDTGGADGIPCVRVGTSLRFPRLLLEKYIEQPITVAQLDATNDPTDIDPPTTSTSTNNRTIAKTNTAKPTTTNTSKSTTPQLFKS
jgi:hypothetical protein